MQHQFARLINLEAEQAQVLLTLESETDSDDYHLFIRTEHNGISMTLNFKTKNRQLILDQMNAYSEEQALKFFNSLVNPAGILS